MKFFAIGCFGAVLGLLAGIAIMTLGPTFFSRPQTTVAVLSVKTPRPDVSITASAPFIASQIQQAARHNNLAKNVTVNFAAPNVIKIAGSQDVSVLGFSITVNATATIRVTTQNGRIILKTENVSTGGLPVSQTTLDAFVENARAQAEQELDRAAQNALRGTNLRVSNIKLTENDVTIELSGQ